MGRRLTEKQLVNDLDYAIATLERIQDVASELIRRREHEAQDGFPSSSMGGGSNTGEVSSPTESAALARPMVDPVAGWIDQVFKFVAHIAETAPTVNSCLSNVAQVEEENRGRVSSLQVCRACDKTITGEGDDRDHGTGFCGKCRQAWMRFKQANPAENWNENRFIRERRAKLAAAKVPA